MTMTLRDAIETTGTCRFYRSDPVPGAVLARVLDAARFAPSGGNRQPVRFVIVRDAAKKQQLQAWYLPIWESYVKQIAPDGVDASPRGRLLANADHFARHLDAAPVFIVVCADMSALYPTDRALGRLSIVGGASVYPAVQNLLLTARAEGLGTALTTLLCLVEPKIKDLLRIPDGIGTAAMITLGYPARGFPKRLRRRPLAEVAFAEEWERPLPGA